MASQAYTKTFMDLPAEIRIRVYRFLFDKEVHLQRPGVSPTGTTIGGNKPLHIAPLLVSKQVRKECIVQYIRNSILYIDDEQNFFWVQRELKVLFGEDFDWVEHVRRIKVKVRWSGDALRYIKFLGKCRGVKEITIVIDAPLPLTANLISWTFHLHLLEEQVSQLDVFNLVSSTAGQNALVKGLQNNLRLKLLANTKNNPW